MSGEQAAPPSPASLRDEARRLLDQRRVTGDREEKHRLAVRAFELVQLAEQLMQQKRPKGKVKGGQPPKP
jgi:hypothetical protein